MKNLADLDMEAVVLAGGASKRMKSRTSKVLFGLAGRRVIDFPVAAALSSGAKKVQVVVSRANCAAVTEHLAGVFGTSAVTTCVQAEPRGTGDAVRASLSALSCEYCLIVYGDTPLLSSEDVVRLCTEAGEAQTDLLIVTAHAEAPTGFGRILRDAAGRVLEVREEKDLTSHAERAIAEVNAGIYLVRASLLVEAIGALSCDNAQGEYYLTDIVGFAARQGRRVGTLMLPAESLLGFNDREQLVQVQSVLRERIRRRHRAAGVSVAASAEIDDLVELAEDVEVRTGACLRGRTRLGSGTLVDVGCVLEDVSAAEDVVFLPYTVATRCVVGCGAQLGPFTHARAGTDVGPAARLGNFVETKNTALGRGAKAGHLSYLGDSTIGDEANIGAGTIFCNYDGFNKHRTEVGAGAFIGSDSQLVAPVCVGERALVAAGTTVTDDVAADAFVISRGRQVVKPGQATTLRERARGRKRRE